MDRPEITTSTTGRAAPKGCVAHVNDSRERAGDNERISAPDLAPVAVGEVRERGQVGLGLEEHLGDGGKLAGEHVGDEVDVRADLSLAGLGEDRADRRGDHLVVAFADLGQDVAHEVDPAALPAAALEDGPDGVDQAAVGVADDELDAVQATLA